MLSFLDLDSEFSDDDIARALASSDTESFRRTEATQSSGANFFIGPGQVAAWRNEPDPSILLGFRSVELQCSEDLRRFDYDGDAPESNLFAESLQFLRLLGLEEKYLLPRQASHGDVNGTLTERQGCWLDKALRVPASLAFPGSVPLVLYGQPSGPGMRFGSRYEASLALSRARHLNRMLSTQADELLAGTGVRRLNLAEPLSRFSRQTEATLLTDEGELSVFPVDVPRLDQSGGPSSLELTVEGAATNLLRATTDLTNDSWASQGLSRELITDSTGMAFCRLRAEPNIGHHWLAQAFQVNRGVAAVCVSVLFEYAECPALSLQVSSEWSWASASFDALDGHFIQRREWGGMSIEKSETRTFGTKRHRVSAAVQLPSGSTDLMFRLYLADADGSVDGHIEGGVLLSLPQIEVGRSATSPIPNSSSTTFASRAADHGSGRLHGGEWIDF